MEAVVHASEMLAAIDQACVAELQKMMTMKFREFPNCRRDII